ncbi:hypothetical protein BO71DRAFT_488634 [Aspergillus ellipticus CBS 707.79]|uniref:Uncharacterized protein n=1 Tax=Aspergillus ellipticus CBS 707.79 TaxID=1448320 RepID=A0A319CVU1_9EURO|nr:hypothetical protein BO71DRAFT_488634 [Aspergillus ellipticus CBS 707.79]
MLFRRLSWWTRKAEWFLSPSSSPFVTWDIRQGHAIAPSLDDRRRRWQQSFIKFDVEYRAASECFHTAQSHIIAYKGVSEYTIIHGQREYDIADDVFPPKCQHGQEDGWLRYMTMHEGREVSLQNAYWTVDLDHIQEDLTVFNPNRRKPILASDRPQRLDFQAVQFNINATITQQGKQIKRRPQQNHLGCESEHHDAGRLHTTKKIKTCLIVDPKIFKG